MLLLNLSLWKEITFCIHCSPVAGLSGWMYIRFGISGSALPATNHRLKIDQKTVCYSTTTCSLRLHLLIADITDVICTPWKKLVERKISQIFASSLRKNIWLAGLVHLLVKYAILIFTLIDPKNFFGKHFEILHHEQFYWSKNILSKSFKIL